MTLQRGIGGYELLCTPSFDMARLPGLPCAAKRGKVGLEVCYELFATQLKES